MGIRMLKTIAALILLSAAVTVAQDIPGGTVLPVMLNSTLDAGKDKPGRQITGKIMQDLPLPDGASIPKGSRVVGHIVSATPAAAGSPSHICHPVRSGGRERPDDSHRYAFAGASVDE